MKPRRNQSQHSARAGNLPPKDGTQPPIERMPAPQNRRRWFRILALLSPILLLGLAELSLRLAGFRAVQRTNARRKVAGIAHPAGSASGAVYWGISGRAETGSGGLGAPRQFWALAGRGGRRAGSGAAMAGVARLLPHEPDAWFQLANLAYNASSFVQAQGFFREALKRKPDLLEALNGLGLSLLAQGQADEAMRQFKSALRLAPSYSAARVATARVIIRLPLTRNTCRRAPVRTTHGSMATGFLGAAAISGSVDTGAAHTSAATRSEEHTSELQSLRH